MHRYMLDTDICIYTVKNQPAHVRQTYLRHRQYTCISAVTAMELLYGAEHSANPEKGLAELRDFFGSLSVVDYDLDAAAHTGRLRAQLRQQGQPIGPHDQMIAGHAVSLNLTLVTNNRREFDRVPGLRVENWLDSYSSTPT